MGYKYFNFDKLNGADKVDLVLDLIPNGVDGTITIFTEAPWKGNPDPVGEIEIKAADPIKPMKMRADISSVKKLKGKHPLYLVFETPTAESVCTLERLQFVKN